MLHRHGLISWGRGAGKDIKGLGGGVASCLMDAGCHVLALTRQTIQVKKRFDYLRKLMREGGCGEENSLFMESLAKDGKVDMSIQYMYPYP